MALRSSISDRSEYQKMFLVSKELPARKADNLTAICESVVYTMWDVQHLTTL
jgi:hypothetical protein